MTSSPLGIYDLRKLPIQNHRPGYFDSTSATGGMSIETYASPHRAYVGAQRRGVSDPHPEAASYSAHLGGALSLPFPMAFDAPLPRDFETSLNWVSSSSLGGTTTYWGAQLSTLSDLANDHRCSSAHWYALLPIAFTRDPLRSIEPSSPMYPTSEKWAA